MDAAVVDDIGLDNLVAACLEYLSQRESKEVVTDMAKVEGLVGVGGRIFDHHQRTFISDRDDAIIFSAGDMGKHLIPETRLNDQVKEALYHVETRHSWLVFHKPPAYSRTDSLGRLACSLHPRENDNSEVALKLLLCGLGYDVLRRSVNAVKFLYGTRNGLGNYAIYRHIHYLIYKVSIYKVTKTLPNCQNEEFYDILAVSG